MCRKELLQGEGRLRNSRECRSRRKEGKRWVREQDRLQGRGSTMRLTGALKQITAKASAELRKEPIGIAGLVLTSLLASWTFYASYLEGPRIDVHFGSEVFVVGHNRVGVTCVFTNRGAKPGVLSGLLATVDQHRMRADRLSVGADTFAMAGGIRAERTQSTFEYFRPIVVPARENATAIVWFVANVPIVAAGGRDLPIHVTAYFEPDLVAASRSLTVPITGELLACIARSEKAWREMSPDSAEVYRECVAPVRGWNTLAGAAGAPRLRLTERTWARKDSNLRLAGYEPAVLTTELRARRAD
jgi:hypothetical protein